MRRPIALILTLLLILSLSACGDSSSGGDGEVRVVATVFAAYDFAREILGERGQAELLLPPGSEAHSYEPTPKDIIDIQSCSLFICVGGESEAWVADILSSIGGDVRVVTLMDCVETLAEETVEGMEVEEHGHEDEVEVEYDEHVWTSPRNAMLICEKISSALCEADPDGAEYYSARLENYLSELDALDNAFRETVENGSRNTIVFGDRFPLLYFARAYGLDYYAAYPGCSDDAEPSAATVAFLIDKVREEDIPVVFHIELSNENLCDVICDETGARKLLFSACHNVTRRQFNSGVTYLSLMWENVEALKEALA